MTIPRRADGVVAKQVGEELVLLDFDGGVYYGLDHVGARIWQLLGETDVNGIVARIVEEYDVDATEAERDVTELLVELRAKKLIA